MTFIDLLLWTFLYLPILLFVLIGLGSQCQRGGYWSWLIVVDDIAFFADLLVNWTAAIICFWEFPKWRLETLTDRLERLVLQKGRRSELAWAIARLLNWMAPSGCPVIKSAAYHEHLGL
jgi:hypothetical protein